MAEVEHEFLYKQAVLLHVQKLGMCTHCSAKLPGTGSHWPAYLGS